MVVLADGEESLGKAICGKWSTEVERDDVLLVVVSTLMQP